MTQQELLAKLSDQLDSLAQDKTQTMPAVHVIHPPGQSPEEIARAATTKQRIKYIKLGSALIAAILYVAKGHAWVKESIAEWKAEVRTEAITEHTKADEAKAFEAVVESNTTEIGELGKRVGAVETAVGDVDTVVQELRDIALESAPKKVRAHHEARVKAKAEAKAETAKLQGDPDLEAWLP